MRSTQGSASEVIAGELEQIEGNEVQLARRRGVALKRGSAYRREVLDDLAVAGAERDELPIEDRPSRCFSERLQQRAEAIGKRLVREIGERRPAPQSQRLAQLLRRDRRLGGCRLPDEALEALQVELVAIKREDIAGGTREQLSAALPQRLA